MSCVFFVSLAQYDILIIHSWFWSSVVSFLSSSIWLHYYATAHLTLPCRWYSDMFQIFEGTTNIFVPVFLWRYISRSLEENILHFIGIYYFSKCLYNFIPSHHDKSSHYFRTPQPWMSSVFFVFLTQGSVKSSHGFHLYSRIRTEDCPFLNVLWTSFPLPSAFYGTDVLLQGKRQRIFYLRCILFPVLFFNMTSCFLC